MFTSRGLFLDFPALPPTTLKIGLFRDCPGLCLSFFPIFLDNRLYNFTANINRNVFTYVRLFRIFQLYVIFLKSIPFNYPKLYFLLNINPQYLPSLFTQNVAFEHVHIFTRPRFELLIIVWRSIIVQSLCIQIVFDNNHKLKAFHY